MTLQKIVIKGARTHNLKNIDVEIPRNQLVILTGLSGSGKSSLAFDTIYAEGQRRYVESLSTYARQFLEQMDKPDLDSIDGLSPAIAIEQKVTGKNPRSTVGTVTEIYDYLRLLYARVGDVHCYHCGRLIVAYTIQQMVDQVLRLPEGTRFSVLAPLPPVTSSALPKQLADLSRQGYQRLNVNGDLVDLSTEPKLDEFEEPCRIEVYVDRLVRKEGIHARLTESIETALQLSGGVVTIAPLLLQNELPKGLSLNEEGNLFFSEKFACTTCDISYPERSPRLFSFNNPQGACPTCDGLGAKMFFDPDLIVPDEERSLREGAIDPWEKRNSAFFQQTLEALASHYHFDMGTPWSELPETIKTILLQGSQGDEIAFYFEKNGRKQTFKKEFEGVIQNLERRFAEYEKRRREQRSQQTEGENAFEAAYDEFSPYMRQTVCEDCQGTRLRKEARAILVGGLSLPALVSLSLRETLAFFKKLTLAPKRAEIAHRLLKELTERISFLVDVGVGYLTLNRPASTLSGGESQRIRLATQIGSTLVGVLYVLDEPSIGLHQRDNQKLLTTLIKLRDMGNSVLVVEHDEETIWAADYVIDMGPRAGVLGGRIVAAGKPEDIASSTSSLTGAYLSGRRKIEIPKHRRSGQTRFLTLRGASANNLRNVTARFPIGALTAVTGVSGSGKSTLVMDTLLPALKQKIHGSKTPAGTHQELEGTSFCERVVDIDQSPIGRTPRSNPATYTGILTLIRELFAALPESKARGYKAGRYSFNIKGGRCEACQGDGILRIEMHFLSDVYVVCESCEGRRFNRETLEVHYKGASIADVLDMTVLQASEFLAHIPKIKQKLDTLRDVGLGYITLGQSATTLSGGEAQRIKLARELSKKAGGHTVYILDEPTTGLHFEDVRQLLDVLQRLVEQGNTMVVIEHNLDVIKCADHVIDMGPEGGDEGGTILASGTPEDIAAEPRSYTGQYLKKVMEKETQK